MISDEQDNYEWDEPLPPDCPPKEAYQPTNESFYRLVLSIPPTDKDFFSNKKLYPDKSYRSTPECIARACSLFSTFEMCARARRTSHLQTGKSIIKITLPPDSGLIKPSRGRHHYSWWRLKEFNPILHCSEAE